MEHAGAVGAETAAQAGVMNRFRTCLLLQSEIIWFACVFFSIAAWIFVQNVLNGEWKLLSFHLYESIHFFFKENSLKSKVVMFSG